MPSLLERGCVALVAELAAEQLLDLGHDCRIEAVPEAQALAELQKYARKQKARVGNG